MPDYRRTQKNNPLLYPQLVLHPEQVNNDQIDRGFDPLYSDRMVPSNGGAGNDSSYGLSALNNINERLAGIQQLGDQRMSLEDQLASLHRESNDVNPNGIWQGLKEAGSSGLDLLGRGLNAITPSQDTIDNIAMRLQRAHAIGQGTLPYYMQEQMAQQQMAMQPELMAFKREQMANQLRMQQETVRQNQWEDVFKVLGNNNLSPPQQMQLLKNMAQTNPQASGAAQSINEKMLGKFRTYEQHLPRPVNEYIEGLKNGSMNWDTVAADLDVAESTAKEQAKSLASENAQQKKIQGLIDRLHNNPESLNETELELLDKYHTAKQERALKIQQLQGNLTKQSFDLDKSKAELQILTTVPKKVASGEIGDGKKFTDIYNPQTGKVERIIGSSKPLVEVNTGTKASEEAQKRFMDKAAENYDRLRNVPDALANIEDAKKLIPTAKNFMGPAGETLLEGAKFLNNRFGMKVDTAGVKSAEELRSRIFFNIMDNLKKLDAQPSQQQQQIMQDSLGKLGTDPKAMGNILDAYGDSLRRKVEIHNSEIDSAEKRNVHFPFDARIKLTPKSSLGIPKIKSDAEFDKLPSGSIFIGPDGKKRTKP